MPRCLLHNSTSDFSNYCYSYYHPITCYFTYNTNAVHNSTINTSYYNSTKNNNSTYHSEPNNRCTKNYNSYNNNNNNN